MSGLGVRKRAALPTLKFLIPTTAPIGIKVDVLEVVEKAGNVGSLVTRVWLIILSVAAGLALAAAISGVVLNFTVFHGGGSSNFYAPLTTCSRCDYNFGSLGR